MIAPTSDHTVGNLPCGASKAPSTASPRPLRTNSLTSASPPT
ncbi:hypothetical protein M2167_006335 [Streptomyces sp. SPB4]|nr:hypothetical protein [Streptomyces sp. SPB4]